MKIVKFVPAICKGDDAEWEGYVAFRSTTFDEKSSYMEAIAGLDSDDEGAEKNKLKANLNQSRMIVEFASKHITEVCLKKKDGSSEAKSVEDMKADDELHDSLTKVSVRIVIGPQVGNA